MTEEESWENIDISDVCSCALRVFDKEDIDFDKFSLILYNFHNLSLPYARQMTSYIKSDGYYDIVVKNNMKEIKRLQERLEKQGIKTTIK